jgi:hypothetical protein
MQVEVHLAWLERFAARAVNCELQRGRQARQEIVACKAKKKVV